MTKKRIPLGVAAFVIPCAAYANTTQALPSLATIVRDAKGNRQTREHDPLGRVVRVREPDGNLRELTFDAEGNVVHARDKLHDVRFAYQGMGRLVFRTEAGTTVGFAYDTEEHLLGITNEHGSVYSFELGPTGQVNVERGFDGSVPCGRRSRSCSPSGPRATFTSL